MVKDAYSMRIDTNLRTLSVTIKRHFQSGETWTTGDLGFLAAAFARRIAKQNDLGKLSRRAYGGEDDTVSGTHTYAAVYNYSK